MSESTDRDETDRPPGFAARALLRRARYGSLATLSAADGSPFVSIAAMATDMAGNPLLLASDLARHTQYFRADPRVSLAVEADSARPDRLAGPRLTVSGLIEIADGDGRALDRYLVRHPEAHAYKSFRDFHVYRLRPERGHFIAGFAQVHDLAAADLVLNDASWRDLDVAADDIVRHMNEDHADAVTLYAEFHGGAGNESSGPWRMTAIDPEGCDLVANGAFVRVPFAETVTDAAAARAELVRLAKDARQNAGPR